ncbi:MAG: hypothetical protein WDZ73_01275 [Candidatus Paceibacterota bacterium]
MNLEHKKNENGPFVQFFKKGDTSLSVILTLSIFFLSLAIFALGFYVSSFLSNLDNTYGYSSFEGVFPILIIYTSGMFCLFNSCDVLFFPFFPTIAYLSVTFLILRFFIFKLNISNKIRQNKEKIVFMINGLAILIIFSIFFLNGYEVKRNADNSELEKELTLDYYLSHSFVDSINSANIFIYPNEVTGGRFDGNIVVSDIYGSDKEVVKKISPDSKVSSVSPKGTHAIIDQEIVKLSNLGVIARVDVEKESSGLSNKETVCSWSPNGLYVMCLVPDGEQRDLLLFDLGSGNYKSIYNKKAFKIDYIPQAEGFSWDENNDIYLDMNEEIYKINNVEDVIQSNFSLDFNLHRLYSFKSCGNTFYYDNNLYCTMNIDELNDDIVFDQKHPLMVNRDKFLVAQSIESPGVERILHNVPLSIENYSIVDNRFAVIYADHGYDDHLVDMQNKKIRPMWQSWDKYSSERPQTPRDEDLIFNRTKAPYPVIYTP